MTYREVLSAFLTRFLFNRITYLIFVILTISVHVLGQCPQVNGESLTSPGLTPSATPKWYQCANLQNAFNLNITTPTAWTGPVTVNWGDGTTNTVVSNFSPSSPIPTHSFAPLAPGLTDGDSLFITISNGTCTVTGILYRELPVNASIGIPPGENTFCAPANLVFTNLSTNVSETTTFVWNFGDNTPPLNFDDLTQPPTVPHTFNSALTCTPTITLTASNYCRLRISGAASPSTTTAITIINKDIPIISASAGVNSSATRFCYPDTAITFTNNSTQNCPGANSAPRTERWIFNRGSLGTTTVGPTTWPPAIPQEVTFPGLGSYQVTLEATNECGMADTTITVQVVTPPTVTITTTTNSALDGVICQGETVTFSATRTGNPDVRKWNFPGTGWFSLNSTSTPFTFNTAGTFQVGTMVGFGNGSASCTDTAFFSITVLPSPAVTIVADDDTGCDSHTVLLTANSPTAAAWNWNFGTGMGTSTGEGPHTKTYADGTNVLTTYTVSLTVQNTQGCSGNDTQTINVYNSPIPSFTVQNLCEGQTAQFTDATPPRPADNLTSWNWTFGDGTPNSNVQNPSHFYNSTGSFPVTLSVTSVHCSGSLTQNISVEEAPVAVMTSNTMQGCAPLTVAFGNTSEPAFDYEWTFGDGTSQTTTTLNNSPSHTYFNATDQSVTFTAVLSAQNQFGCGSTDTLLITALPSANADFVIPNNTGGCSPYLTSFTNLSTNASTYNWNFGDNTPTSNLVNPTHTYINSGGFLQNFDVRLIAASPNGCNDTTFQSVPVFPLANYNFVLPQQTGCSPVTLQMPAISGVQSYSWNFGDGSPVDSNPAPIHTFENITGGEETYTVTFIGVSPFGCRDTSTAAIDVLSQPVADFAPDTVAGCSPFNTLLRNFSEFADTFLWDYGDGSTSATEEVIHEHLFINSTGAPVTRTVTLTASNASGCVSELSMEIDVFPSVQAAIEDPGDFCSPATFELQNESVNASNFIWSLDTGQPDVTGSDPLVSYINSTSANQNFDIRLISSSVFGCSDTAIQQITIFPEVTSNFTPDITSGCGPLSVNFINAATNANQFSWNYGDGITSSTSAAAHNHTFENFGASPITRQVTLTAQSTQGCSDVATQTIIINPNVQAGFVNASGLCAPAQIAFQNTSNNANTFNWQLGNGSNPTITAPVSTFNNTSATDTTFNIRLIASSSFGCADTVFGSLLVHPEVVAAFANDINEGCGPLEVTFTNGSENSNSLAWNYGDGVTSSTSAVSHNHTFENFGSSPITRQVTLTAQSTQGCSDVATQTIVINPTVQAGFVNETGVCAPAQVAFQNTSNNANTFSWQLGNGSNPVISAPVSTFNNTSATDTTFNIRLIASSSFGCADTVFGSVLVHPEVVAAFDNDVNEGCGPLEVSFTNGSENSNSLAWNYGDGVTSSTSAASHNHTFENFGGSPITRQVTLTAQSTQGCSDVATQTILINPTVQAGFVNASGVCAPAQVAFQNTSNNANTFSWQLGNGSNPVISAPVSTFNNTSAADTTFNIRLIASSSFGCADTVFGSVLVHPEVVAEVSSDVVSGCAPLQVALINSSINVSDVVWDYGDGETSTTEAISHGHTFGNPGGGTFTRNVLMRATSAAGCQDEASIQIQIFPQVVANFPQPSAACSPSNIAFENTSINADVFNWDFGNGNTSNTVTPSELYTHEGSIDTIVVIRLIASSIDGCADTVEKNLIIKRSPLLDFALSENEGCAPLELTIQNNSENVDVISWDYGDGENSANFLQEHTHEFDNPTGQTVIRQITLTANTFGGCSAEMSLPLQVFPDVIPAFSDPLEFCSPASFTLFNASINAAEYLWDFGNGLSSTSFSPDVNYVNQGVDDTTFVIKVVVESSLGCTDSISHDVVINPAATADFEISFTDSCSPVVVSIDNQSFNADNFTWEYGDGATDNVTADHNHSYINQGTDIDAYELRLTVSNVEGCGSTVSRFFSVYPVVEAVFSNLPPACSPYAAQFISSSVNADEFSWDYAGQGSSNDEIGEFEFLNETNETALFTVRLAVNSEFGCTDTATREIAVLPSPQAQFSLDVNTGCAPFTVNLSNSSSANADSFSWNYGDGDSSAIGSNSHAHEFNNIGETIVINNVTLTAFTSEGCSHSMVLPVEVKPIVQAAFNDLDPQCAPVDVTFVNSSIPTTGITYEWDLGLISAITDEEPTQSYTNTSGNSVEYNIRLIASSAFGCRDTAENILVINSRPVAQFTADTLRICTPFEVNFTNTSIAADSVRWFYGDGAVSSVSESIHGHEYFNGSSSPINYNIVLTAFDSSGCSSEAFAVVQALPDLNVSFVDPFDGCTPLIVNLFNTTQNGGQYSWDFGNGASNQTSVNAVTEYVNETDSNQVYTINLTGVSPFGCQEEFEQQVTVFPGPRASFNMSSSEACHPAPITFFNETVNGNTFFWEYGDGENSQVTDDVHIHTFGAPVTGSTDYIVQLTVTSANGCVDAFDSTFTLYPVLIADFFADSIGCSPFTAGFQNESLGASAYQWVFGDGVTSNSVNPVHNYITLTGVDTFYTAELTAFNEFGCESVRVKQIEVRSTPEATVSITDVTGCFPRTVTFLNSSEGANSYIWTYGTGQFSETVEPLHSHDFVNVTDGIFSYQVLLEAVSAFGCVDTAMVSVEVPQEINALFTSIPGGCTPLELTFDNNSEGGTNYDWNFGDGSDTSAVFQPTHTFINPNTSDTSYTIQLIVSDEFGCADTTDMSIAVYTDPIAAFDVTPEVQTWPNATVNMTNATIGGQLNAQWNMNTGDFLFDFNPPAYTYNTWGEYTIQLVVANGSCQDTAYRDLIILPPPAVANFEGDSIGCAPLTVKFTNLSEYIVESRWDFGDGGESQVTDPVYTYYEPGTYSVKLSILGPDSAVVDTIRRDIVVVVPTARASFTVFPSVINVPVEPVNFVSISENATEFSWDFGDGGSSEEENPEYTYTEVGDYDVTLIVNNENNCPDTVTRAAVIEARASGVLEFPSAFTPNQQFASGGPYDSQSLNNDMFFPRYSGVDTYELRIFNKWGELIFYTNDIKTGWDGYYQGAIVEQGVYVWNAKGVFLDGRTYEDTGDITLIIR